MIDKKIAPNRRAQALDVLGSLLRRLQSIHADLLYVALTDSGFNEDEACRLTGALLKTAQARGWCVRTDYSIKSKRNHSNNQSVLLSEIFGKMPNGRAVPQTEIKREYNRWNNAGYRVPDQMAIAWKVAKRSEEIAVVSFQQPPQHPYYGASIINRSTP